MINSPMHNASKLKYLKATELPLEKSTLPILSKGGDNSPNVLFQVHPNSLKDMAGSSTDYPSMYDPGSQ